MTEHPYEFGGILFTVAIIAGVLGGIAFDNIVLLNDSPCFYCDMTNFLLEVDNGVHDLTASGAGSGGTWIGHDYYEDNNNQQLDCKKSAISLQEFYECVND